MLELYVLASGSTGNATIVRNAETDRSVLIDCGIGVNAFFAACKAVETNPRKIEAILITHRHTDHTKGLGVVLRGLVRMGCRPPIYTHKGVRNRSRHITEAGDYVELRDLPKQGPTELAGIKVTPFRTKHDVEVSLGFRLETKDDAIGYMTDSGIVTKQAHDALKRVRILAIESNHDVKMLENGPYPYHLKQRILGNSGHLSNEQCCSEVGKLLHPGLKHVVAMHISEHNNTFELPAQGLERTLKEKGHPASVHATFPRSAIFVK